MNKRVGPRFWLLLVVGVVVLLTLRVYSWAPYAPRTASELCGAYVLDCELVHEELILHPDGTFTQTVTIKETHDVASSKGKWTYATDKSYGLTFGTVTFNEGFLNMLKRPHELDPDYGRAKPGITFLPVEYWLGELTLGGTDSWPEWRKLK